MSVHVLSSKKRMLAYSDSFCLIELTVYSVVGKTTPFNKDVFLTLIISAVGKVRPGFRD